MMISSTDKFKRLEEGCNTWETSSQHYQFQYQLLVFHLLLTIVETTQQLYKMNIVSSLSSLFKIINVDDYFKRWQIQATRRGM